MSLEGTSPYAIYLEHVLKCKNYETIREDNKAIQHSFEVSSQENHARNNPSWRFDKVEGRPNRYMIKSGEVWNDERARLIGNDSDLSRQVGEEIHRLKYENQRLLQSESEKPGTLSSEQLCSDSKMEDGRFNISLSISRAY